MALRDRSFVFDGLESPLQLNDPAIVDLATRILHGWPVQDCPTDNHRDPFAEVSILGSDKWRVRAPQGATPEQVHDPVNAICDLIVEISWEQLRSRSDLLCLHAAAVEFDGRLVLMPNARRAGKSTLAVALAQLGHRVFTDDFLPIQRDPSTGALSGLANGIAPRLRIPVPQGVSDRFRAFVDGDGGPQNRQYKYLTDCPVPPHGTTAPIGAIVLLDRQDTPQVSRLESLSDADAISSLILQNFARHLNGGAILKALAALAEQLPCYRLVYSDVESAAALLSTCPELAALPAAHVDEPLDGRPSPLKTYQGSPHGLQHGAPALRLDGCEEVVCGSETFVATPDGRAIHRLNPGLGLYWRLLAEPTTVTETTEILAEIYPEVEIAQLRVDAGAAFDQLHHLGLIRSVPPSH
ncbi:PqqD family peptide modification chaperone [Loktanella sp. IMCC34160]|uniref:PqqD family peptide modification chaperone n=1 Tax=Loktanella sp. IMCC34160 TaxID=2510646 RepID=UPI0013ED4BE8|nr:PqqD family peptide modification chaperone [Loktanella sp. IMCC34160]